MYNHSYKQIIHALPQIMPKNYTKQAVFTLNRDVILGHTY